MPSKLNWFKLKIQELTQVKKPKKGAVCDICGKRFKNERGLEIHKAKQHPNEEEKKKKELPPFIEMKPSLELFTVIIEVILVLYLILGLLGFVPIF